MITPAVIALLAALLTPTTPAADSAPTLDRIPVRAETSSTGYTRAAFGRRWHDIDRDGCGQRDDVLARDLRSVTRHGRCVVTAGRLTDPYTGRVVTFTKARASDVEIDHVVSLAEAWRSGARTWTPAQRETYANDLAVLLATARAVNRAKSDHDPATWAPIGAGRRCTYARHVITIKIKWRLTVDQAERTALRRYLAGCW